MKMKLTKMCGAGNDFLITDETQFSSPSKEALSILISKIQKLCDRKFGIGADGFCFLSRNSQSADLKWDFFNRDGSTASLCGNAACCVIEYALQKKLVQKNPFALEIHNRLLIGEVKENKTWIQTQMPELIQEGKEDSSDSKSFIFKQIDAGVLHLVIDESTLLEAPQKIAQKLRKKYPDSNVTFYTQKKSRPEDQNSAPVQACARTFERGIEDFTLACGTGALAVAYLIHAQNNFSPISSPSSVNQNSHSPSARPTPNQSNFSPISSPSSVNQNSHPPSARPTPNQSNFSSKSSSKKSHPSQEISSQIEMPGGTLHVIFKNNQAYLQSPVQWIAEISSLL